MTPKWQRYLRPTPISSVTGEIWTLLGIPLARHVPNLAVCWMTQGRGLSSHPCRDQLCPHHGWRREGQGAQSLL